MPTHVTFIGAGEIGTAVAGLVKTSGARIDQWDALPGKVPNQKPLATVVPNTDVIFLCVASWNLRGAMAEIVPYLSKKTVIVSLSKGIELRTRFTIDEMLADGLPRGQATALLSGPMLATELKQGLMGAAVVASRSSAAAKRVAALFKKSVLRVSITKDIRGTSFAGVLKNIYALGLGIADALELGSNATGWLVEQAMHEMMGILKQLNSRGDAVAAALGPAGLGDLVATGSSPFSSNRRVGGEIVAGKGLTKMSEGYISIPSLRSLLGARAKKYPFLQAVAGVVIEKKSAKTAFTKLLTSRR